MIAIAVLLLAIACILLGTLSPKPIGPIVVGLSIGAALAIAFRWSGL